MNKEFVSYEQAVALKELGFDERCLGWYSSFDKLLEIGNERHSFYTLAPLKQQVFRWFREKYDLTGLIHIGSQKFSYSVNKDGHRITPLKDYLNYNGIYEKAENACIDKLIELAKK